MLIGPYNRINLTTINENPLPLLHSRIQPIQSFYPSNSNIFTYANILCISKKEGTRIQITSSTLFRSFSPFLSFLPPSLSPFCATIPHIFTKGVLDCCGRPLDQSEHSDHSNSQPICSPRHHSNNSRQTTTVITMVKCTRHVNRANCRLAFTSCQNSSTAFHTIK